MKEGRQFACFFLCQVGPALLTHSISRKITVTSSQNLLCARYFTQYSTNTGFILQLKKTKDRRGTVSKPPLLRKSRAGTQAPAPHPKA